MNDQDTPKLLPCPFCGPQADEELAANLREVRCLKHDYAVGYTIFCACCGVEIHDEYKDDLVTIWNTRPAMPDTTAQADTVTPQEAAKVLLDYLCHLDESHIWEMAQKAQDATMSEPADVVIAAIRAIAKETA